MKKNYDIEALRAIAVIYVLLAHVAALLSPTSAYWKVLDYSRFGSGVDLFFAISGFVITKSIARSMPTDLTWRSFVDFAVPFWRRRFWRLYPSVFVWVSISVVISITLAHTGYFFEIKSLGPAALAALFQYADFTFHACRVNADCGELGVYWSLSLENQFYLALPLIVFFCPRKHLVKVFLAIFAAQFFIPRTLSAETPLMWPFRTDAIALGVVIALSHEKLIARTPAWFGSAWKRIVTVVGLLFALAILTKPVPIVSFAMGLTALVSALLVWIASFDKNFILPDTAFKRALVWIGARSYAIYLCHPLMILVTKFIWFPPAPARPAFDGVHTFAYLATFLTLTIVAADLNYRFIESTLRVKGKRPTPLSKSAPGHYTS